ncbi:positive regulator of gluconeogenesis [Latilactobacillus curvatus]|uniref:pyruvate, water dikinase regulatory protein n=1 Tax=Latilactobacillus curvatus TaxID=28038 RepID=UPI000A1B1A95|nr:pyruvate, water dikinase regulatory protein [Latilactobacillus curvatus]SMH68323.1 positive regulator of gluconeogenesis [Latilactobacillus curvatus]
MPESKPLTVFVLSDSVGQTALQLVQAALAQFPDVKPDLVRFPFVHTQAKLMDVLSKAVPEETIVVHTLATNGLSEIAETYCQAKKIASFDMMSPMTQMITAKTNSTPTGEAGALHHLNDRYFDRISAMEFAVMYDDGKDPHGFLEADIVLLGVSRTSKTPLSLFLANRNIKVANLPIVPQAHIPDEIWRVDPKKIIGLMNTPEVLNNIRRERMIAYGLNPDTTYSDMDEIKAELAFAQDLYDKIGCQVINVANRSIEETATIILERMGLDFAGSANDHVN